VTPVRRRPFAGLAVAVLGSAVALSGCVESGRQSTGAPSAQGCPFEADDSVTTTARIAFQAIPNGDLVVKDQRLLETCMPNAKITWSRFESGGDVIQAFGSGSVDVGLIGSSPATRALSAPLNIDIKVVWIHDVIGDAESLIARDATVKDISGLRGKTVAVAFSSTAHYSLLQALQDAGLDPASDVKIINLAPENMPAAWQGKQIDAAWVWDPTLSELRSSGGTAVLSSADTAEAGKPTYDLGAATTEFVEANPEFMRVWAKAQDAAVTMIRDEPQEAAVSVAATLGISPEDVQKQFAGYQFLGAEEQAAPEFLGGKMAEDLQATAGFLLQQGGIEAVSPPATYVAGVDAEPAKSAAS
jgi:taurine transport system substrate-binding protein